MCRASRGSSYAIICNMKSISAINPIVTENTECLIVKECTPFLNQNSGCVTRSRCINMLCFHLRTSNAFGNIPGYPFIMVQVGLKISEYEAYWLPLINN